MISFYKNISNHKLSSLFQIQIQIQSQSQPWKKIGTNTSSILL